MEQNLLMAVCNSPAIKEIPFQSTGFLDSIANYSERTYFLETVDFYPQVRRYGLVVGADLNHREPKSM